MTDPTVQQLELQVQQLNRVMELEIPKLQASGRLQITGETPWTTGRRVGSYITGTLDGQQFRAEMASSSGSSSAEMMQPKKALAAWMTAKGVLNARSNWAGLFPDGAANLVTTVRNLARAAGVAVRGLNAISVFTAPLGVVADVLESEDPQKIEQYALQVMAGQRPIESFHPTLGAKIARYIQLKLLGAGPV